jgi:4-hydroxy-3-methylbut-2-enyl diphosphate reductase IspH
LVIFILLTSNSSGACERRPGQITVGGTAGASCPNNPIKDTIRRLFELRGISMQELLK